MHEADARRLGAGQLHGRTLIVDEDERRYVLYRPETGKQPQAVVIVLHGYAGNADDARLYGMEPVADREGFVVAYAEAPGGEWNIGHQYRNADPVVHGRDDVGYLDALIADLSLAMDGCVAPICMLGVSMGGMMAVSFAAARPQRIAALAGVISGMTNRQPAGVGGNAAVPYMLVIGEADRLLPPDRGVDFAVPGQDGAPLWLLPYEETLTQWARWHGCDDQAATSTESGIVDRQRGELTRHVWSRDGRARVVGCRVRNLGHRWPGLLQHPRERIDPSLSTKLGPACAWPEGAELVWRFFSEALDQGRGRLSQCSNASENSGAR